jgi:hypothetical protein
MLHTNGPRPWLLFDGQQFDDAYAIYKTPESKTKIPPEISLWADVLNSAIGDLDLPPNNIYNSVTWFLSDNREIGSFLWICETLDLSPYIIIRRYGYRIKYCLENIDGDGTEPKLFRDRKRPLRKKIISKILVS